MVETQGVVAFSSQGDRIALTQIEQMIDGQYRKLGYYDVQADNLTWHNAEQWIGGKVRKFWKIIANWRLVKLNEIFIVSLTHVPGTTRPYNRSSRSKDGFTATVHLYGHNFKLWNPYRISFDCFQHLASP